MCNNGKVQFVLSFKARLLEEGIDMRDGWMDGWIHMLSYVYMMGSLLVVCVLA